MLPEQQQRIMGYFIEEAKDHLNTLEQGLLNLQGTLQDQEMVNEVFRAAHSVKGGAAMLGISSIQKTAHRLEDYFKILKEEECPLKVDQKLESLFLQVFDALKELLEQLQGPFGLTEDVANGIMSGVEPVFEQLHNHLDHLVHQTEGTPAKTEAPVAAPVPKAVPVVAADPILVVFQSDVSTRLRDLLQLFKQSESAQSRQQLQDLCTGLKQIGEPFNLTAWCELLEVARQAIACPDNSYRILAPIVIKEIKQAQDLVLARQAREVWCSDRLRELVPTTSAITDTTGEVDLADLFATADSSADNLAVDEPFFTVAPPATPEFSQSQTTANVITPNAGRTDYGFGDDLANALEFEQPGPEVGMAELNSLADLFEGEVLDLGATWQEEEIIGPTTDSGSVDLTGNSDLDDLTDTNDFSDLLSDFDDDESPSISATSLPQADLVSLFGDEALLGDGDGAGGESTANSGSPSSVTDEIDALFGDEFLAMEEGIEASNSEANQVPLDDLGELFAELEESETAVPEATAAPTVTGELAAEMQDEMATLSFEPQLDEFNFDSFSEATDSTLPEELFESSNLEEDLGLNDLDLFGDSLAEDNFLPEVTDASVGDLDQFFTTEAESATLDDPLSELLSDESVAAVAETSIAESPVSLVQDPWAEEFQVQPQSSPVNLVETEFSMPDNFSEDLFGLNGVLEVEEQAPISASEVLDDSNALDFDLSTLSEEFDESLITPSLESSGQNNSDELLPDFNFNLDDSLRHTDDLSDSSNDALDFLLEAADLAEIQLAESSSLAIDPEAEVTASLDDFWADGSPVVIIADTSETPITPPSVLDDLPETGSDSEMPGATEPAIDFSGSLDSLFDETSEDFGSLDLDDFPEENDSDLGAIVPENLSTATDTFAEDLFGLPDTFLDAGFEDANSAPELNLEDMGETSDLEVDLFKLDATDDGPVLEELSANLAAETPVREGNLLPDLDIFSQEITSEELLDLSADSQDLLELAVVETVEDPAPVNITSASEDETEAELDDWLAGMAMAPEVLEGSLADAPLDEGNFEDEFADLDALLGDAPTNLSPSYGEAIAAPGGGLEPEDEFADLDALLGETSTIPAATPPVATPVPAPKPVVTESEFDDLEKLLEDADKTMGGSPTVKSRGSTAQPRRPKNPNVIDQTMRVPVKQLDNLSNLVGELVVNRNSLEQDQERLRQFLDNLLYQVQQLSDVGQRMRDLYERSLLESSLLASRQGYHSSPANGSQSHSTGASFDALEMDRFTGFHSLSQEMIELIVRVRESSSDIEFIIDETDQVTRNFRQVTTQLQEGLTRSRMVPFAQTADRLPRGVRDNAIKCGKQAELVVEGRETLIDKMILEQLYDPLNHLVNNAIAHGIETPDIRQAAGKPPVGRVTIRAFYQGNQTVISVSDDGAGIDPERIKAKAIQKRLITPAEAKNMSRLDVYDILFAPGFSGVDQVTDLAGRGVGMDVVRTRLNEIRGSINIDSTIGKGTTFTIRLPLTLSISKALCCISNRARIAFPMDGVEDMLDVPKERIQTNAEGQSCILWRDLLLPFQSLSDVLKYSRYLGRGSVYGGNQEDDIVSIVVLRSAGNFIALQVDQVLGEQEIVIKQLEGPVPKPVGVAGATVLGDGRIMPIADVLELIDLVQGRIRHETSTKLWEQGADQIPIEPPVAKTEPTVLIVDDSITVRELLSMTFNKVGYRVEQARDGQEAWEKLRSGLPCDMVFCDIEMPRMDGLELLSRIQKDTTLNHLPIAMLTSRGADRHRQMAVQLGARGYFTKPYLEEALLDAAQRLLKGEVLVTSNSPG